MKTGTKQAGTKQGQSGIIKDLLCPWLSLFCPFLSLYCPCCPCFAPACPHLSLLVPVLSLLVPVLSLVKRGITGLLPIVAVLKPTWVLNHIKKCLHNWIWNYDFGLMVNKTVLGWDSLSHRCRNLSNRTGTLSMFAFFKDFCQCCQTPLPLRQPM